MIQGFQEKDTDPVQLSGRFQAGAPKARWHGYAKEAALVDDKVVLPQGTKQEHGFSALAAPCVTRDESVVP